MIGVELTPLFMYGNDGRGHLETIRFRALPEIDLWVFAPRFADMDGDGLTDLAVVADYNMSRVYLNVGDGMFKVSAEVTEVLTDENGMGSAIGTTTTMATWTWFVSSIFGRPTRRRESSRGQAIGCIATRRARRFRGYELGGSARGRLGLGRELRRPGQRRGLGPVPRKRLGPAGRTGGRSVGVRQSARAAVREPG